jgi:hypothetical protein
MTVQIVCLIGSDVHERFPELADLYWDFDRLSVDPVVMFTPWRLTEKGRRFWHAR